MVQDKKLSHSGEVLSCFFLSCEFPVLFWKSDLPIIISISKFMLIFVLVFLLPREEWFLFVNFDSVFWFGFHSQPFVFLHFGAPYFPESFRVDSLASVFLLFLERFIFLVLRSVFCLSSFSFPPLWSDFDLLEIFLLSFVVFLPCLRFLEWFWFVYYFVLPFW